MRIDKLCSCSAYITLVFLDKFISGFPLSNERTSSRDKKLPEKASRHLLIYYYKAKSNEREF